jgi:endonuclease-3
MTIKERYEGVLEIFEKKMPSAETELSYHNPFELLVAVILSAQCTDKRVNLITPKLFEIYPDVNSLATATVADVFAIIRSISYPNNKAKHLIGMANILQSEFNGIVPSATNELQRLPGVGRKTANVISSVIFNMPTMAVDTHVFRVSARIGLTRNAKTPLATEKQLIKHIPKSKVHIAHHWLILHGRYICTARSPKCENCDLIAFCKYFKTNGLKLA